MAPLIVIPLKRPKEADLGIALLRELQDRCAAKRIPLPAGAREFVQQLQQKRNLLVAIDKLTQYTADDVTNSFLQYEASVRFIESRFDKSGAELQVLFKWRDAFQPSKKCEYADLKWERACAYFSAAAALSFKAAAAQQRGAEQGGFRDAANFFKQAAGCLDAAFSLIKGAIWGLTPRLDPKLLTADVELPMLEALRQLMLAQAQRVFYEKGAPSSRPCTDPVFLFSLSPFSSLSISLYSSLSLRLTRRFRPLSTAARVPTACSEGSSPTIKSQLSAGTASLFADVLKRFEANKQMEEAVAGEAGLFSKPDRSWLGRIECSKLWAEALAEEHAAEVEKNKEPVPEYGNQVARLWRAVTCGRAAVDKARSSGVPAPEFKAIEDGLVRLLLVYTTAEKECRDIYEEPVPTSMPPLERKVLVAPTDPPEVPLLGGSDALRGMLVPRAVERLVAQHHTKVQELLREASTRVSTDAEDASRKLSALQLPHELDARTNADMHLPPEVLKKVNEAKQLGSAETLQQLRMQCEQAEEKAELPAVFAQSILDREEEEDKKFVAEQSSLPNPEGKLASLKTSEDLTMCRSKLSDRKSQFDKAKEVTKGLCKRMDEELDSLMLITKSIAEIEAEMPHLDGTTLEQEPCVGELRSLIQQLEQLKIDSSATLGAAKAQADAQERDLSLCERVLDCAEGESRHQLLDECMQPLNEVRRSLFAINHRRAGLLCHVETEHKKFREASVAEASYPERVTYFERLNKGAEQLRYLHEGFTEGLGFYQKVVQQFEGFRSEAQQISDARKVERIQIIRPVAPPPPPTQVVPQRATPCPAPTQPYSAPQQAQPYGAPQQAYTAPQQAQPYGGVQHAQPYGAPQQAQHGAPQRATPYGGVQHAQPYGAPQQAQHGAPQRAQPYGGVQHAQPYGAPQQAQHGAPQRAQPYGGVQHAQPYGAPQQAQQPARPTPKMACYNCKQQFGVPPNAPIAACPFCKTHNRVPPGL